jgi:hypothetical protein
LRIIKPMPSLYDYDTFQSYLFELESALSRIGLRDCQDLKVTLSLAQPFMRYSGQPHFSGQPTFSSTLVLWMPVM